MPDGESGFNLLFSSYKHKALLRGFEFSLTRDEFKELTTKNCAYCQRPPSQERRTHTGVPYLYTGVDRIDSARGYVVGNVAPCCLYCNRSKSDMPLDEWRKHITMVWETICQ